MRALTLFLILTACGTSGTLTIKESTNSYPLAGSINNKPVYFVVDTGSTFVSLPENQLKDFNIVESKTQNFAQIADGSIIADNFITIPELDIGPCKLKNVKAVAVDDPDYISLFGISGLDRLDVHMRDKKLTLGCLS